MNNLYHRHLIFFPLASYIISLINYFLPKKKIFSRKIQSSKQHNCTYPPTKLLKWLHRTQQIAIQIRSFKAWYRPLEKLLPFSRNRYRLVFRRRYKPHSHKKKKGNISADFNRGKKTKKVIRPVYQLLRCDDKEIKAKKSVHRPLKR